MELESFLHIGRRWAATLVLLLTLGAVAGYAYSQSVEPVYRTRGELLVGPINSDRNTLEASGQAAQTLAQLAGNQATIDNAYITAGIPADTDAEVVATANEVTRILRVTVQSDDPEAAARVATAVLNELQRLAAEDAAEDGLLPDAPVTKVVENPAVPSTPVSPNTNVIVVLGALAGLTAALAMVIGIEYARRPLRVVDQLSNTVPEPTIGTVERSREPFGKRARELVSLRDPIGPTTTSLRGLGVDVVKLAGNRGGHSSVVVCGTSDLDRSADVAANLAATLGSAGRRVALIDASRGSSNLLFRLEADCRRDPESVAIDLVSIRLRNVTCHSFGTFTRVANGIVGVYAVGATDGGVPDAQDLDRLLRSLAEHHDHVIIHCPPAFGSLVTAQWAAAAGATLLVVTAETSSEVAVQRCAATLRRSSARFVGIVFDERPAKLRPLAAFAAARRRHSDRRPSPVLDSFDTEAA